MEEIRMPQKMTEEEYRDLLISKISRATTVVNDLSNCKGFEYVVEDVSSALKQIDDTWHMVPEDDKWANKMKELRLTKMSSSYIVNLTKIYKSEIDKAQAELNKLENPDVEINKDFDAGVPKQ